MDLVSLKTGVFKLKGIYLFDVLVLLQIASLLYCIVFCFLLSFGYLWISPVLEW